MPESAGAVKRIEFCALLPDNQHMATFVIIPADDDSVSALDVVLKKHGNSALRLPRGEWMLSYDGTSRQISDELDISTGNNGAVIMNISAYWGFASREVWEWLAQNMK